MSFRLGFDAFEQGVLDSPENVATTANLKISVANQVLTLHNDPLAKSVRSSIRVSLYPLANWLARSYWRLCFETLPRSVNAPPLEWRLAHELSSAGDGFEWPKAIFVPEGDEVIIWNMATRDDSPRSAYYLNDIRAAVPLADFRREITHLMQVVLTRLESQSITRTPFQQLWPDLLEEIGNADLTRYRIAEARLGFDPDAVPEELVNDFLNQAGRVGPRSLDELAPVCARSDPAETLKVLEAWVVQLGVEGHPQRPSSKFPSQVISPQLHPAQRGYALAGQIRQYFGISGAVINNRVLADCLGLSEQAAFGPPRQATPDQNISLALRRPNGCVRYGLRRKDPRARRFELARVLCDQIIADPNDQWFPVTPDSTVRQKIQRACAAELLCPVEDLTAMLNGDFSEEATEEAAFAFSVQPAVVQNQLENHRVVSYGRYSGNALGPYDLAA